MKDSGYGVIMDMVLGLVGALIGGFISSRLGMGDASDHGLIGSTIIGVLGAILLTLVVRLVSGKRPARRD